MMFRVRTLFVFTGLILGLCSLLSAQLRTGGGTAQKPNSLYGDFKVRAHQTGTEMPQTFLLILRDLNGNVLGRQAVVNGGRYRYLEVPNGDYILTIYVENREMTRISFRIDEFRPTDIRKDLDLEWQTPSIPMGGEVYARSSKSAKQYTQAERASAEGDFKKASTLLREIVAEDPQDYEAWTELGTVYFRNGKLKEADKAYVSALEVRPNYQLANLNLGKVRVSAQDYANAIEPLVQAVQQNPEAAESHYLLGEAYLQVKKGSTAVDHFYEALRLAPVEMADAHLRLATLYNLAGWADRASQELEKYLEKRPNAPNRKEVEQFLRKIKQ